MNFQNYSDIFGFSNWLCSSERMPENTENFKIFDSVAQNEYLKMQKF